MNSSFRLGFIGAGNMAQAIGASIINKKLVRLNQISVSAPSKRNFSQWEKLGVDNLFHDNLELILQSDVIFLAMKPQYLDEALKQIHESSSSKLIISVIAGLSLETLNSKLRPIFLEYRLVKAIPNTALLVGAGCTVICPDKTATNEDINLVTTLMSAGGIYEIISENLMNAVSSVSGAGIAFAFTIIEALSDGAVKQGVPRALSYKLAAQTLLGAAKMVLDTDQHPAVLKDNVCSPGGVTICGIHALERGGLRSCLMNAIEATTMKSYELDINKKKS